MTLSLSHFLTLFHVTLPLSLKKKNTRLYLYITFKHYYNTKPKNTNK